MRLRRPLLLQKRTTNQFRPCNTPFQFGAQTNSRKKTYDSHGLGQNPSETVTPLTMGRHLDNTARGAVVDTIAPLAASLFDPNQGRTAIRSSNKTSSLSFVSDKERTHSTQPSLFGCHDKTLFLTRMREESGC